MINVNFTRVDLPSVAATEQPYGDYNMIGNETATALVENVWTKIAGVTASRFLFRFSHPSPNRMQYAPSVSGARVFRVIVSASIAPAAGTPIFEIAIYKNGSIVESSITPVKTSGGSGVDNATINTFLQLATSDDYFEVWIRNPGGSQNAIVSSLQVTIQ